jgi:hypothetical protein
MYGQQATIQIQPHHQAALQYLPGNFPPFFQGVNPNALYAAGINDLGLASVIQRLLLRYIITSFKPNIKLTSVMYQILSTNEFQNQEFLNVTVMAIKASSLLMSRGYPQENAINESVMNAASRWGVNYLRNNGMHFNVTPDDLVLIDRIDANVKLFENKVQGNAPQQQHNQQYPGSVTQHIQQQNNQYSVVDTSTAVNSLYRSNQNAPIAAANNIALNSGILLSTLDCIPDEKTYQQQPVKPPVSHQHIGDIPFVPPVHLPTESEAISVDQYMHMSQPPVPVSKPIETTQKTKEASTMTVENGQFPTIVNLVGSNNVEFEKHDLKRLLRNVTPGFNHAFEGVDTINSLVSASMDPTSLRNKNYVKPEEGETGENVDIGTDDLKTIMFSNQEISAINDDDLRISLSYELSHLTRAVITTVAFADVSVDEEYIPTLNELFSSAESHLQISEIINTVLTSSTDLTLIEIIKVIDRRLCDMVTEIMNIELGLKGSMGGYAESIVDVLNYLATSVNQISYDHVNDQAHDLLLKALSGKDMGLLEDLSVVCLTRCTAAQFPYVIGDVPGHPVTLNLDDKVVRINPLVTPELHKGLSRIFQYANSLDGSSHLVRKVYLMTFDGAKVSLYRSPFTNCIIAFKETH